MNLFRMASRGVELDALPDDEAPRSLIDFGPTAGASSRTTAPPDLDPLFEAAASEYGVDPTILKGIAYAESRFRPNVIDGTTKSSAGALGMMQFMPATAREMGINPLDPVESVFGAAAYLRQSLDKFDGDTEKAVASYNWGRSRSAFDREDWFKSLPTETRNYVGTVLEFADGVSFKEPSPAQGVKLPLPAGVTPSSAGAGRGTLDDPRNLNNPENAPQTPFYERVVDSALTLGKGVAAANPVLGRMLNIAGGPKEKPLNSVLEGMQLTGTPTDLAEAERLSRRDYAENAERARFGKQAEMRAPVAATGAQAYAEANPLKAAFKGDAARTMGGALNLPSVVAGVGAETVNRLAADAGVAPVFGRVENMPLVDDLRKVTQDYASSLSRRTPGQAWDNGEFGRWMMTQMAGNSLSAAQSLGALFLPGAQATLLGSMGATAAGSAYADGDSASAAALKGLVEVGSEKLPLHAAEKIKDLVLAIPASARNQVLAEAGKRLLAAGTAVSANSLVGAIEETAAEIGGNAIDKYVQGKNKSLFEDVDRAALVGAAFGGGMSAPAVMESMANPQAKAARALAGALQGDLPAAGGTVADMLRTGQNNTALIDPAATSRAAADGEVARLQAQPVPSVQDQPTTPQAPVVSQAVPVVPQAPVATTPEAKATQAVDNIEALLTPVAGTQPAVQADLATPQQPAAEQQPVPTAAPVDVGQAVATDPATPPPTAQAAPTVEQAEQKLAEREAAPLPPVEMQMRPAGTLLVKGDPAAIRARLLPAGVDNAIDVPGGLIVSRTQAAKAQEVLSAPTTTPTTVAVTPQQEVANVPQNPPQTTQQQTKTTSAKTPVIQPVDAPIPAAGVSRAGSSGANVQAAGVEAPAAQDALADLAAMHETNGPYPPSAATRIGDGQWQPAVKTGPASGRPIDGAPMFADAGSATAWAKYEQAKSRDGADVAALQRLQETLNANTSTPAVRLADASRPGAVTPASDTTGQQGGDARGVGRAAAGQPDTSGAPGPAVRTAVPDAGGGRTAAPVSAGAEAQQFSKEMTPDLAAAIMTARPPARATKDSVNAALAQLVPASGRLQGGLGKVVVANASEIQPNWEPLIGPVDMASEDAGQAQGFYDPRTRTVFLIADHIKAGTEMAVAAHELMHKHGQAVLGADGWGKLHSTIERWANAPANSTERLVYDEAVSRVEASRPSDISIPEYSTQELFPYAVQIAMEMGVQPSTGKPAGTVAGWLARVRNALKGAWTKITGKPDLFDSQDLVNLAFGIAQRENPEQAGEMDGALQGRGLDQFKALDDIFALPKSTATDLQQIARDNGEEVRVRTTDLIGEKLHTLTFKDGTEIRITERKASPFGQDQQVYAYDLVDGTAVPTQMGRPGENPEDVPPTSDVWLDVSRNTPAKYGAKAYNIAATFAHNTGQIFVGDPAGLSDDALRRRTEQMLSSALKFGTTEHLAPHPRQVAGDANLGVPPLKWVYGDHVGNVERMIDVSLDALDNALPNERNTLSYDRATGQFRSNDGNVVQPRASAMGRPLDDYRAGVGKAQAGWRTLARAAYLRSFRGADGRAEGSGILDQSSDDVSRFRGGTVGSAFADPKSRIFYSRATADDLKSSMGAMTPDQEAAWSKAAGVKTPPTIKERAAQMKANFSTKARQGIVDQFAPIADLDQHAYMLARMSKGSDGTMEAALLYGRPFLRDGVPDVDVNEGGFARVLAGLKGEHDRFLWWVAALRAENLKAQGKENLLDTTDIDTLKTLNDGTMADGSDRAMTYAEALLELNDFNNAVLQMAKDSGLIDQAAVDLFKDQPYVPFYRLADETGQMQGPRFSAGLTNQKAWKKLKGGTQQINADLLQNMLMNWSSLYGAAARNRAALATMDAAEQLAVAYQVPEGTKGAAKVMRDGVTEHWAVEDPYLLEAISALNYTPSPLMKALSKPKQLLTWGVTVNPTFKIRNLIRDSVSAIAMADLNYNFVGNAVKGWKLMDAESQTYASMLASGGVIKFGTQENTDRLRNKVAKLGGIVLDQGASAKLWGRAKGVLEAYQELGDKSENVNRAALYDRLIAKGHSHAEASFMARDLMDFSMGGNLPIVRFLTQTVPFLNARLQGLYKLGRAAGEDPARFAAVVGAVSVASLILLAMYHDDDDWKKREDWDRDGFWWFKIGQVAFRIPKPFEVGALGTLSERTAELIFSREMDNKRFMERLRHMLASTFSLDPIPQAIKPLLDVSANKDSFTGRAIETQADQKLRPQDRYGERTPEIARLLGSWGLPDPLRLVKGEWSGLSPKQIEHLLRGYFSWAATATFAVTDAGASLVTDKGEKPDLRLKDMFLAGNFVETLPSGSSRYVSKMYEQARDAEQAYASYQAAVKAGDKDRVAEIRTKDLDKLKSRELLHEGTQALARINLYSRMVEADKKMTGEQKRKRLDDLEQQRHKIAQKVIGAGAEGRTQSK